jgi:tRNA modification GTPase
VLTPVGRGALAVVGVAGPGAASMVDAVFDPVGGRVAERPDGAICFGRWRGPGAETGEDVVVARLAANRCEVHCHGGRAAPQAIIGSLVDRGAALVSWEAWLRSGENGVTAADLARIAICRAGGPRAARILGRQIAGALDRELGRIVGLRAAGDDRAVAAACDRLLQASRVGLRLTTPWRVAVVGPVNAGKSSLVNALAGHARSIVSAVPGTTRDLVAIRIVLDGWEVELVDTAGLRRVEAAAGAERAGIGRALAVQAEVDLILRVTAPGKADAGGSSACGGSAGAAVGAGVPPVIDVLAKADLRADRCAPATAAGGAPTAAPAVGTQTAVVTSAATGQGIDRLAAAIVAALVPETTAAPDLLSDAVPFTPALVRRVEQLCAGRGVSPPERRPSSARGGES